MFGDRFSFLCAEFTFQDAFERIKNKMIENLILSSYNKILFNPKDQIESIGKSIAFPFFSEGDLISLIERARDHFANQPVLARVSGPAVIVGDLHGNIIDLIRILQLPDSFDNTKFIFLGDYVDRGQFSIEVMTLLMALTITYPENFILLRGNHEFAQVNANYGFKDEIMQIYQSENLWNAFNQAFAQIPLACVINDLVFCVHGGISPSLNSLSQIERLKRPIMLCEGELLYDLMWSDPTTLFQDFVESKRGQAHEYGYHSLKNFLNLNKLTRMVRGHECVQNGFLPFGGGRLVTVFSSSNYEECSNDSAILIIDEHDTLQSINFKYMPSLKREDARFITVMPKIRPLMMCHATLLNQVPSTTSCRRNSFCQVLQHSGPRWKTENKSRKLCLTRKASSEKSLSFASDTDYYSNIKHHKLPPLPIG